MKCRKRIRKLVKRCKDKKVLPTIDEILKHTDMLLKESRGNREVLKKTLDKVENIFD